MKRLQRSNPEKFPQKQQRISQEARKKQQRTTTETSKTKSKSNKELPQKQQRSNLILRNNKDSQKHNGKIVKRNCCKLSFRTRTAEVIKSPEQHCNDSAVSNECRKLNGHTTRHKCIENIVPKMPPLH